MIDVGYAGVVGADRIAHGEPIYDNFPKEHLPGRHLRPGQLPRLRPLRADLALVGNMERPSVRPRRRRGLRSPHLWLPVLLGIRIRPGPAGRKLAATLAFGWAAYPYTAYALESNSNDTLVALLLVATLLVLARPMARGAMTALATFTKFAPVLLAPMLMMYGANRKDASDVCSELPHASVLVMLVAGDRSRPHTFYERTIAYQAGRNSPFSIWGQVPSLEPLRIALLAATAALSLLLAFRPRKKTLVQVAALGAALLIALQLAMHHWFYLYIVWFYPLLLIAMASLKGVRCPSPRLVLFRQYNRGQQTTLRQKS